MLQLGGTLVCSSARKTSSFSRWIYTSQNLLYASTAQTVAASASAPQDVESTKAVADKEKLENIKDENQQQGEQSFSRRKAYTNSALLTATFKSLSIASEAHESTKIKELNDKVRTATTVDEILAVTDDPDFNKQNAAVIIPILYNWISDDKIKMVDLQVNRKFWKAFNTLGITKRLTSNKSIEEPLKLQSDLQVNKVQNLNNFQTITLLSKLASKQERITPLLQAITAKLADSNDKLNIKLLADILYSVSILTFYNNVLMEKISKDLIEVLPSNENSAVVGSILRSLGTMRYRDEALLNVLSMWIIKHRATIRPQEINSLLLTLAYLGFTPNNMNELKEKIIDPLNESDMCTSSEWLDVIWSLTVLDQVNSAQLESILNSGFLSRLLDLSEYSVPKSLKILNIDAKARLTPNYKGPLLPNDSPIFGTTVVSSKEKRDLSNSIISALKILSPSDSIYLNINTRMGFLLDAEICVDNKCSFVPVNTKPTKEKEVLRIAILTCSYHDFCRGITEISGPMKFYGKLLQKQGYKIMMIPYTDVNIKDKLIQRVQYINDNLKKLVQVKSQ